MRAGSVGFVCLTVFLWAIMFVIFCGRSLYLLSIFPWGCDVCKYFVSFVYRIVGWYGGVV